MTSSPSRSSKRGEVVDEFRQHDGVVTVVVKLFLQGFTKHKAFRTEDGQEGEGAPAHGLVNRGVPQGLALLLYLYVEPWGPFLEKEPPQSRFGMQGRVLLGFQYRMPGSMASGP